MAEDLRKVFAIIPQNYLRKVFAIIPQNYRPMVIFIDDLDRCSPNKVADVVEALNLFLAGEFPDCMFVLGIDDEMVAAALDKAHGDVIAKLPSYAKSASIGWRFMDKFVQLPFIVPPPGSNELSEYVASLFSYGERRAGLDMGARDKAARVVEQPGGNAVAPADIVEKVASDRGLGDSQREQLRKEVEVLQEMDRNIQAFSDKEDQIKKYLLDSAARFSSNPRDLKRFVNVFRFYYFLRAAREARGEPVPSLDQVSRWITLSLRWPEVVRWLRRVEISQNTAASSRLGALEALGESAGDSWNDQVASTLKLTAKAAPWIEDAGIADFFRREAGRPQRERISSSCGKGLW